MFALKVLLLSFCFSVAYANFFDPHNHINGILPWQSLFDLHNFPENRNLNVDPEVIERFWITIQQNLTSDLVPLYGDNNSRKGSGTLATLAKFTSLLDLPSEMRDGIMERLLTTTPFTEFDSAYDLISTLRRFTKGSTNDTEFFQDLCTATINELQLQKISKSEQSVSLASYSWSPEKLCWLDCFRRTKTISERHSVVLLVLTDRLAFINETHFSSFRVTGECQPEEYLGSATLPVDLEKEANQLIEQFTNFGVDDFSVCSNDDDMGELFDFQDILVGVDVAAPEVGCFTEQGMLYVETIALGLQEESKRRKALPETGGRNTRLLFHVHVGEGFSILFAKQQIHSETLLREDFPGTTFEKLPADPAISNLISNTDVAAENVRVLVAKIEDLLDRYESLPEDIIFRLGHVTHIDENTAQKLGAMARKHPGFIEADINLDSNLITGAYPIPADFDMSEINQMLKKNSSHFEVNKLPEIVIPDPNNCEQVVAIYGDFFALKYLLMYGCPVVLPSILGTDGPAVEHADMARQHQLGKCLIEHWNNDPEFAQHKIRPDVFKQSSLFHLKHMGREEDVISSYDCDDIKTSYSPSLSDSSDSDSGSDSFDSSSSGGESLIPAFVVLVAFVSAMI